MKHYMLAFGVAAFVIVACGSDGDGPLIGGGGNFACAAGACGGGKCDTNLGCVECLGDGDCHAGELFCIAGRCEACRTSADCGAAAPVCWPGEHKCNPKCSADGDCPKDAHCDTGTGACVQCRTKDDCRGDRPLCDDFTKECVECIASTDCPATEPRCVKNRCAACTSDADCPASAPRCDLEDLKCKAAPICTDASGCAAPTPICDDGARCVECKKDEHCPAERPRCKDRQCTIN